MNELRQDLFDKLVAQHDARVKEWLDRYTRLTRDIQEIKSRLETGKGELTDDSLYHGLSSLSEQCYEGFIQKLINEQSNGIANSGQSIIKRDDLAGFLKNARFQTFLSEIISSPLNPEVYAEFNDWWKKQIGVLNKVLINRIFAACAPGRLSTVVDAKRFDELFAWVQEKGIIGSYTPTEEGDSWLTRNIFLMNEFRGVDLKGIPEGWLNMFPWLLYEYMDSEQGQSGEGSLDEMEISYVIHSAFSVAANRIGLTMEDSVSSVFCAALQAKPFLILTGLSGSGKTQLAMAFTKWITTKQPVADIFQAGSDVASSNVTYHVAKADRTAIEFWNSADPDKATKVTLPREMIQEWADYIRENAIPKKTLAREIREGVKGTSKFSDQLHSFETHLKAAAFALLENQVKEEAVQQVLLISVGADWTSNENLLGYPDALNPGQYRKPDNGVLDLILNAQMDEEHPYFLILDEMNLSHVERYFADFLSAMESGESIHLHEDTEEDWNGVPAKLKIPDNLFVIGTVNIDETIYMFSPKVLDRANVIEFRVDPHEIEAFLENPVKPDLDKIAGQGAAYAKSFVAAAKRKVKLDPDTKAEVKAVLMEFFNPLQEAGAEFGYRTAHEICRFVYFHDALSGAAWSLDEAMDAAVMQKLLPKLHGSRRKLEPVLETLEKLCTSGYPRSLEKIQRMMKRLRENGFTSFAEA